MQNHEVILYGNNCAASRFYSIASPVTTFTGTRERIHTDKLLSQHISLANTELIIHGCAIRMLWLASLQENENFTHGSKYIIRVVLAKRAMLKTIIVSLLR